MKPIIRKRKIEDSDELAHCIAVVWNTTYNNRFKEIYFITKLIITIHDRFKPKNPCIIKKVKKHHIFSYILTLLDF